MHRPAFTLIEIMVVVLVIGILSTFAIPQFLGSQRTSAELNTAADDLVTTLRYLQRRAVVTRAHLPAGAGGRGPRHRPHDVPGRGVVARP